MRRGAIEKKGCMKCPHCKLRLQSNGRCPQCSYSSLNDFETAARDASHWLKKWGGGLIQCAYCRCMTGPMFQLPPAPDSEEDILFVYACCQCAIALHSAFPDSEPPDDDAVEGVFCD